MGYGKYVLNESLETDFLVIGEIAWDGLMASVWVCMTSAQGGEVKANYFELKNSQYVAKHKKNWQSLLRPHSKNVSRLKSQLKSECEWLSGAKLKFSHVIMNFIL